MNVRCLASSSSGNCFAIEMKTKNGDVKFLIECGIPYAEIIKKLISCGWSLQDMRFCLITHAHGDHSLCLDKLHLKRFSSLKTAEIKQIRDIEILEENQPRYVSSDIRVTAFPVEHDCPGSVGFIIESSVESILFTIDCKYYEADLSKFKFDYVFTEANYNTRQVHTLYENAKKQNDIALVKRYERVINAHMSLSSCIKHLKKLDLSNCKAIFLTHLSDGHANEYEMKIEVAKATGIPVYVCGKNGGVK